MLRKEPTLTFSCFLLSVRKKKPQISPDSVTLHETSGGRRYGNCANREPSGNTSGYFTAGRDNRPPTSGPTENEQTNKQKEDKRLVSN